MHLQADRAPVTAGRVLRTVRALAPDTQTEGETKVIAMAIYMTANDVLKLNWKKNPRPLRDRGGIYRIIDKRTGELLYVGQATSLGNRLAPSAHPIFDRSKHDVFILFEASHAERCKMEGRFIELLKPKLNKRNGTMPTPTQDDLREYFLRIFG